MPDISAAIQQSLDKANARLKSSKISIGLKGSSNAVHLRGTFPPKPGSDKDKAHQQRIYLQNDQGSPLRANSVAAIQWAEQQAKRVSSDVSLGKFCWADWVAPESVEPKPSGETLASVWGKYQNYKATHLSSTTIETDFRRVRNHLVAMETQGITSVEDAVRVKDYFVCNTTPATAKKMLMELSACFGWAVERAIVPHNPFFQMAPSVKVKKTESVDPFTQAEVLSILEGFTRHRPYYVPFVKFLFLTGCRTSEAIALPWSAVDPNFEYCTFDSAWTGGIRKETKTGRSRRFPCGPELQRVLKDHRDVQRTRGIRTEGSALVFPSPKGHHIDAHNFLIRSWKKVLALQGVRYRYQYQTRHTFASNALASGVVVSQVAQWLGNSQRVLLGHYSGITQEYKVPEIFGAEVL